MSQIDRLRRQLQLEQQRLDETREAIASVSELLEGERDYTQKLLLQDSQASTVKPQEVPKKTVPSKADRVAEMSDQELLAVMSNPKKREELLKGL